MLIKTRSQSRETTSLVSVQAADELIRDHIHDFGTDVVAIDQANSGVLRQPVLAERDEPPFDRVMIDGIGIRYSDWADGIRRFRMCGEQAAGRPVIALTHSATCVEIMTGAVLPGDCDCVIPIEKIVITGKYANVAADYIPRRDQFVHGKASAHVAGDALLDVGTVIRAPEMAILASAGKAEVAIARPPSFAVLASGDELVDVGLPIEPYQIRRSNDRTIETALRQHGFDNVVREHVADDPRRLFTRIAAHLESADVLVISGGVSKGRYDYMPEILDDLGVDVVFHWVAQKPGRPLWFGTNHQGKAVFAVPGNPVSSLVSVRRYVIPAVLSAMGADQDMHKVLLAEPIATNPDLAYFVPVTTQSIDGVNVALPRLPENSGDFTALGGTDGFIELSDGRAEYPRGFVASLYRW